MVQLSNPPQKKYAALIIVFYIVHCTGVKPYQTYLMLFLLYDWMLGFHSWIIFKAFKFDYCLTNGRI